MLKVDIIISKNDIYKDDKVADYFDDSNVLRLVFKSEDEYLNFLKNPQLTSQDFSKFNLESIPDKVQTILEKVGLYDRDNELAVVLSGGEKQRVGIARAIFKNAAVIYADEPTASLDINNRKLVIELLRQCAKPGAIVVLATHDERLVNECDRIVNMKKI